MNYFDTIFGIERSNCDFYILYIHIIRNNIKNKEFSRWSEMVRNNGLLCFGKSKKLR